MVWDGTQRRLADAQKESNEVILTRICGRIDTLIEGAIQVKKDLASHQDDDKLEFKEIRKDILILQRVVWTATGIIVGLDALPKIAEILHIVK